MPIYEDVEQLRESLNKLLEVVPEADVLLSSWDSEPARGQEEIRKRINAGLEWVNTVHDAVLHENPFVIMDIMETARRVAGRLNLPPFAVNPLFAKTVATHIALIRREEERNG